MYRYVYEREKERTSNKIIPNDPFELCAIQIIIGTRRARAHPAINIGTRMRARFFSGARGENFMRAYSIYSVDVCVMNLLRKNLLVFGSNVLLIFRKDI